jgi:Protein of unknown function (DUF3489)
MRNQRRKGNSTKMTNAETTTSAAVAETGAPVAPAKASSKKQATAKKAAPKTQKPAKGAKPKKNAMQATKATKQEARPRTGSKGEQVRELLARTNGASLAELMQATEWQAHSIRGFLSTASRKRGVRIESFKNDKGERTYRIKK